MAELSAKLRFPHSKLFSDWYSIYLCRLYYAHDVQRHFLAVSLLFWELQNATINPSDKHATLRHSETHTRNPVKEVLKVLVQPQKIQHICFVGFFCFCFFQIIVPQSALFNVPVIHQEWARAVPFQIALHHSKIRTWFKYFFSVDSRWHPCRSERQAPFKGQRGLCYFKSVWMQSGSALCCIVPHSVGLPYSTLLQDTGQQYNLRAIPGKQSIHSILYKCSFSTEQQTDRNMIGQILGSASLVVFVVFCHNDSQICTYKVKTSPAEAVATGGEH